MLKAVRLLKAVCGTRWWSSAPSLKGRRRLCTFNRLRFSRLAWLLPHFSDSSANLLSPSFASALRHGPAGRQRPQVESWRRCSDGDPDSRARKHYPQNNNFESWRRLPNGAPDSDSDSDSDSSLWCPRCSLDIRSELPLTAPLGRTPHSSLWCPRCLPDIRSELPLQPLCDAPLSFILLHKTKL